MWQLEKVRPSIGFPTLREALQTCRDALAWFFITIKKVCARDEKGLRS